jgi:tRNA (uracil-5-)-methyltransferase
MAAMGPTARVSHVLCARTCRFLSGRTASSSSSPVSPFRGARAAAAADPKIGRRGWQWRAVRARLDVAVRPDTYREELDVKIERARSHFAAAPAPAPAPSNPDPKPLEPIELPPTEVHESARANFRMRAEFRVWHDGDRSYLAMFDSDDPKTPIEVPAFPMGSERINDLMPRFLEEIGKSEVIRRKLFQVNFLTTRKGDALVSMLYHKPVKTEGWAEAAETMRQRLGVSIIGRSRKQKVSHRPHTHTHTPPARFHAAFTSTTHAAAGIPKTRKMNHTIESIPELRLW